MDCQGTGYGLLTSMKILSSMPLGATRATYLLSYDSWMWPWTLLKSPLSKLHRPCDTTPHEHLSRNVPSGANFISFSPEPHRQMPTILSLTDRSCTPLLDLARSSAACFFAASAIS